MLIKFERDFVKPKYYYTKKSYKLYFGYLIVIKHCENMETTSVWKPVTMWKSSEVMKGLKTLRILEHKLHERHHELQNKSNKNGNYL